MARSRINSQQLDAFEHTLRAMLAGQSGARVIPFVMQLVRALYREVVELRAQAGLGARSAQPPSERLRVLLRQFSLPLTPDNDGAPPESCAPGAATPQPDAPTEPPPEAPPTTEHPRGARKGHPGAKRLARCTHLPLRQLPCALSPAQRVCEGCGCERRTMPNETSYVLELIPERYELVEVSREKRSCPVCRTVVCAPGIDGVRDGGFLGPALVTEAVCKKVLDALPIERQARAAQQQGVPLDATTLGRACGALLDQLAPLAQRIVERAHASAVLHADSTGLRRLDAKAARGSSTMALWVVLGGGRFVAFHALPNATRTQIQKALEGSAPDIVHGDGTPTLNFVGKLRSRSGAPTVRAGCHAHARRRLVAALRRKDTRALEGLEIYRRLFRIEREASRQKLSPEDRLALRRRESAPLLQKLRRWVQGLAPAVEPKSPLGKALRYLENQWATLRCVLDDGRIELTNNRSERALRGVVLGKHAWLFVVDERNARRWAAAFAVLQTARAHGLNARAYLHAVVRRLLAGHPHTRLDELLPEAMLREHPELRDETLHRREQAPSTDVADTRDAA